MSILVIDKKIQKSLDLSEYKTKNTFTFKLFVLKKTSFLNKSLLSFSLVSTWNSVYYFMLFEREWTDFDYYIPGMKKASMEFNIHVSITFNIQQFLEQLKLMDREYCS